MKISTILDKIDEHQLFVPAFQREYVWKRDDARQLVDSLLKDYPTGTMLTWETNAPPELKGTYIYDEKQGAVRILLDGQQRITTLYMLVKGDIPAYYTVTEIINDTRGLHANLETLELAYYSKIRMERDPRWVNITDVFQKKVKPRDVVKQLAQLEQAEVSSEREDAIHDNVARVLAILDREFPEQTIPVKATIREAIDIFYKVNAGGVALTDAELALAQMSGYWPQARDEFKKKLSELRKHGFDFKLDFVVYVLLGILHHNGSDMRKLHGAENDKPVREVWRKLQTKILDYVVNMMRTHAFVDHTAEINSIYALVPIIVYCYSKDANLPESDIKRLVKWFYYAQIRTRYVSQLPQKLDRDLRIVQESASPFDRLLDVIREERGGSIAVTPEEFEGRAVQHPLFGLLKWYLKSRQAICLTTGVSIRQPMGEKYKLEQDHIFPWSKLKAAGYGKQNRIKYALAQEFTNRALLTQLANRTKAAANAADYLGEVTERFPKALGLQSIPEDRELWSIENYEGFLKARRKLLAQEFNVFLESITESASPDDDISLEELIGEGESEELEFKSSLRWDMELGAVNKKLEDVVLKTIAAFANRNGGTLLIGVADDGSILGLENDFKALGGANKDKYQLHLINLLKKNFGDAFAATKVKVAFPELADSEICQIDVSPANKAVFLKLADKAGQPREFFYVRSGNSSQELSSSETQEYCAERFG